MAESFSVPTAELGELTVEVDIPAEMGLAPVGTFTGVHTILK